MSQLLALASAVLFGLGDFAGGYVTRRVNAWTVTLWSQILGLGVLAIGLVIVPWEAVTTADLVWGGLAGLFGLIGLVVFYSTLAEGPIAIVAPITGAAGASIPVIVDIVSGNSLTRAQTAGIALAIVSIVLVSSGRTTGSLPRRQIAKAILAGAGFAAFFIALSRTSEASGLWPLVASRAVSISVAAAVAVAYRAIRPPRGRDLGLIATVGNLDMAANVAIALSLQRGSLAVNTVLSSLYPAVTAAMAVLVLHERPQPHQRIGIATALTAVLLLAV